MTDANVYYKKYSSLQSAKLIFNLMNDDIRLAKESGEKDITPIRKAADDIISSRFGISLDEVERLYK